MIAQKAKNILFTNFPLMCLIVIIVFLGAATGGALFSSYNIRIILNQMFLYVLGGFGCLFLFAQGGIDLSMAANIGMAAILGACALEVAIPFGIAVTILLPTAIGVIMGLIYAYARIPVFIQGLAMNFLLNGMLYPLQGGRATIRVSRAITAIQSPVTEALIVTVALAIVILAYNYTKFGRECRAIGAGEVAAIQSGINVKKAKAIAFIITGFTCGIAAFLTLVRTGSASQTTGLNFNFNVMLSMILGGCSMAGGTGVKVRNAIIGPAALIVLQSGLSLWGMNTRIQEIVKGVLFILMIVATTKLERKISK